MSTHEIAAVLLSYVLQSGLLLAVGLIAPRLLRLRHPGTLLAYWRILLPTVVLLPIVTAIWQPKSALPILTIDGAMVEEVVATTLPSNISGLSWGILLVPAMLITTLALIRIAVGVAYLRHCRRTATPVVPLPDHVRALQRRFGLDIPFVMTNRLSVPITFGWARPIVMVPSSFQWLSEDEQEGVACHELLHIHRQDWPVAFFEEVVRAVLWFHPAVWILLPKIALSREQVVDEGTVRMTGKRRQYLDALWQIVCSCQGHAAAIAVPLVGRSHLRARVQRLKKEIVMSKTRIIVSGVALVAMLTAAGFVGATVFSATITSTVDTLSVANRWSTNDDKPAAEQEKNKGSEDMLETYKFEGECSEITHPVVVEKINPTYPADAREEKVMGEVVVRSVVTDQGFVDDVRVLESPDERLSMAAVEAVQKWRYEPALCDGTPVSVYYNLTFKFRLQ